ncbi:MAG: hypothetical protein ACRENE_13805 [Polyangiaceae bacterium]
MPEPEPKMVQYNDVRSQIDDGDIILFRGTILLSRIIELISHGDYSHCALAANWGERKMILQAELVGGVQAVPLSIAVGTYKGRVDWFRIAPAARAKLDIAALMAEARADLGLGYAREGMLKAAEHFLFGAHITEDPKDPRALFCSQYVERCYRQAGVRLSTDGDNVTSPTEISSSKAIEYVGTFVHDPSIVPNRRVDAV